MLRAKEDEEEDEHDHASAPRSSFSWRQLFIWSGVGTAIVLLIVIALSSSNSGSSSPHTPVVEYKFGSVPTWTLANGIEYPTMLANTADLTAAQTKKALLTASAAGIIGVDFHDNAELGGVAEAVAEAGRSFFFLTTKINKPPPDLTDPQAAAALAQKQFDDNMAILKVEYLDTLLLKDSPHCPVMQAQWAVVEDLYAKGRVRAIGVYNLCAAALDCVFAAATVKPMIHYLMRHVGMGADMDGLIAHGTRLGMRHTVYGSLGEPVALPELLGNGTLKSIAAAHGRTVEEAAIRWNLQSGLAVNLRMNSNYGASNKVSMPEKAPFGSYCTDDCIVAIRGMAAAASGEWSLSKAEMRTMDALRFDAVPQSPTYYSSGGCPNSFGATMAKAPKHSSCPASGSTWC